MKNSRLVVAALAALTLLALPALAAKPGTADQLRTTRIITKAGTASVTFTLQTDSLSGPNAQGIKYEGNVKKLMVVDWISFSARSGAVAEDFVIQMNDDNNNVIFSANQTVLANTTETMFLQFPTGFPMFNHRAAVGGAAFLQSTQEPCGTTTGAIIAAQGSLSCTLTVGYHMEAVTDRLP